MLVIWCLIDTTVAWANQFVADGDSITAGKGAPPPYTSSLTLNHQADWIIFNLGVSGETLTTMIANAPQAVDTKFQAGNKNIVFIEGGQNDFIAGQTATQVYNSFVTYCSARRAVGWKCVPWTMISSQTVPTTFRNSVNALLLADTTNFDGHVDLTGTVLGCDLCWQDTTWFQSDGVHPTQLGISTVEAPQVSAAANVIYP